jgi:hypothetical protein
LAAGADGGVHCRELLVGLEGRDALRAAQGRAMLNEARDVRVRL